LVGLPGNNWLITADMMFAVAVVVVVGMRIVTGD
jgi:hypothetical protein